MRISAIKHAKEFTKPDSLYGFCARDKTLAFNLGTYSKRNETKQKKKKHTNTAEPNRTYIKISPIAIIQ